MKYLFGFAALVVALAVGDWFPDGDQKTDRLLHRSIATHRPLLPIIVGRQLRVAGGTMDLLALVLQGRAEATFDEIWYREEYSFSLIAKLTTLAKASKQAPITNGTVYSPVTSFMIPANCTEIAPPA